MELIAHRGRVGNDPENAVESLASAADRADGVEIDVRLSADGVPVLMHDPTVDRTTSGTGEVADLSAAAVTDLELAPGIQVPRLETYLHACEHSTVGVVLLDVKVEQEEALAAIATTVASSPVFDRCVTLVRSSGAMERFRALISTARLGALGATEANVDARIETARSTGAEILLVHHGDDAYLANRGVVRKVREAGLRAAASTLSRPEVLDVAARDGCHLALYDLPEPGVVSALQRPGSRESGT